MSEVERILELVAAEKISRDEAVKLLGALSPGLAKLPGSTWERLFAQLDAGMPAGDLAQLLGLGAEPDPGQSIGRAVARAMGQVDVALGRLDLGGKRKTARLMRLEVEDGETGSNVRVNLPLGLANFALKLIPKEAQKVLAEQGLDMATLSELLKSDLPDGNLVEVEDGKTGTEVRIWIE